MDLSHRSIRGLRTLHPPIPALPRVILSMYCKTSNGRWINLWWPAEVGNHIAPEECAYDAEASELGPSVFVGNLVLVVGILLGVFLLHILVVSGVEALWLTKVKGTFLLGWRGGPCLTLVAFWFLVWWVNTHTLDAHTMFSSELILWQPTCVGKGRSI